MNRFQSHNIVFIIVSLFLIASCVKDKPNPDNFIIPNATHHGVLITNEGSYGNNNAELSFLDTETKTIFNQLFATANHTSAGDVIESAYYINGKYYITVNNSNKIMVVDANSYQQLASIPSVKSPRYITQVSADKAYVSCLYFPSVYVLNLNTNAISKTITVDYPNTEKMISYNGYCYVTNWDTASSILYKINTITDSIETRIDIGGRASHEIVQDKNNMLWILSGNKYKNKISHLVQYNPALNTIVKTFSFTADEDPFRLIINASKDSLYFINVNYNGTSANNGLYKMSINDIAFPSLPFIHANTNSYFWAVGFDSITNHIFLSDPKGFTQQSTVYEYSNAGLLLNQYTAGIGANGFIFK